MFNRRLLVSGLAVAAGLVVAGAGTAGATEARHRGDIVAPVLQGVQIYKCTQQADGSFAYTSFNVRAKLKFGIRHSFVQDVSGPPQWVAPDGSAVTGTRISSTPNGEGNIPLLEFTARLHPFSAALLFAWAVTAPLAVLSRARTQPVPT